MHENIMRLWNAASTGGRVRPKLGVVVKTSSYTITTADFGTVFTTRGAAAAVTFTLPAASSLNTGEWVLFINVADYNMMVEGADEGLVVFNNLTADNILFGTASEKIGGALLAISDGTSWVVLPLATETQTVTVDTTATSTSTATATATATSTGTGTATSTTTKTTTTTGTDTASKTDTATATSTSTGTSTSTSTSTATATATATP